MKYAIVSAFITGSAAFPWVVNAPGVDSSMLQARRANRRQQEGGVNGGPATCPFNANHVPAAPVTAQYPYNNAKDGLPGNGKGGYLVPAQGDTAHQFVAPGSNDIRGPCPGLNTAANHNFLAHDGIVTFAELVDAQQNVYNVGYDLANLLALLGLTLTDGDITTEKLSIGCDATTRTSFNPTLTGSEPGLDGHNKFEADSSLTRNDFFTHNGDNYRFNGTLFKQMTDTTNANYNRENLALYRYNRYQQSKAENPNFFFGPLSLLLFGASSFLYELMPSGTRAYAPDYYTISTFFGAVKNSDGTYSFGEEKIPDNWTNRVDPYSILDVSNEIGAQYNLHPVPFGGNAGAGNFVPLSWGPIGSDGMLPSSMDAKDASCLLYQLVTGPVPSSLNGIVTPSANALSLVATKLAGTSYANLGCPNALT